MVEEARKTNSFTVLSSIRISNQQRLIYCPVVDYDVGADISRWIHSAPVAATSEKNSAPALRRACYNSLAFLKEWKLLSPSI